MAYLVVLFSPVFYYRNINPSDSLRAVFVRIFIAGEFSFLSMIFYYTLRPKRLKKLILVLIVVFLLFSIYDYVVSDKSKLGFRSHVVECLILLFYIIYYFYEKIQTNTLIPIYQTNLFWIVVAFIIYCSGNFFVFLYSDQQNDKRFHDQFTLIYSTFTILKNILLCIGVIIKQPEEDYEYKDFITQHNFPEFTKPQENY